MAKLTKARIPEKTVALVEDPLADGAVVTSIGSTGAEVTGAAVSATTGAGVTEDADGGGTAGEDVTGAAVSATTGAGVTGDAVTVTGEATGANGGKVNGAIGEGAAGAISAQSSAQPLALASHATKALA